MNTPNATGSPSVIRPAIGDAHDHPYHFGKPLTYLSERQQVRLLILRGRLQSDGLPSDDRPDGTE